MNKARNIAASSTTASRAVRDGAPRNKFPRRILVALGPEPDGHTALSAAAALAAATGAELVLLGIAPVAIPPADETMTDADGACRTEHWPDQRTLDSLTYDRLARVAASLPTTIHVRTTLDWGGPMSSLLHAEQHERPNVLVVTSAHTGALTRLLDRHRMHRLLRHARVPVLVVPVGR